MEDNTGPDNNATELIRRAAARFDKRTGLMDLWQEIALNFCPWRASFTEELNLGEDFASHLMESTPVLLARDLKGQIGSMLRPEGKQFFWARSGDDDLNKIKPVREYQDWKSKLMRRIIFDRYAGSQRALSVADESFVNFGNAVLSVDTDESYSQLRVAHHHLKDCAWTVGSDNSLGTMDRKMRYTARQICQKFGKGTNKDKIHPKIIEAYDNGDEKEWNVMHCVLPIDEYDAFTKRKTLDKKKYKYVSVWIDTDHKKILRESPQATMRYVVAPWARMDDSPYAFSPAAIVGLPDARLIQQQATILLEAAEKSVSPPLIAYDDTINGDINLDATGITWVDRSYDQRSGDPITPLELGKNVGIGFENMSRTEQMLTRAFYLDVLRMPDTRSSKSTVEIQFKIDEYIRAALPLFAPMETEYNGAFLQECHDVIEFVGGFSEREVPKEMEGKEVQFAWDNPLSQMVERVEAQTISEVVNISQAVASAEMGAQQAPSLQGLDYAKMLRGGTTAVGGAEYLKEEDQVEKDQAAQKQQQEQQQAIEAAPNVAPLITAGTKAAEAAAAIPEQGGPAYPVLPGPE